MLKARAQKANTNNNTTPTSVKKSPSKSPSPKPILLSQAAKQKASPVPKSQSLPVPEVLPSTSSESTPKVKKTDQIHEILRKALAIRQAQAAEEKKILAQPDKETLITEEQLKSMLTSTAGTSTDFPNKLMEQVGAIMPSEPSQLLKSMELLKSLAAPPLTKAQMTAGSDESEEDFDNMDDDEEEEYIEFKFAPRQIFMSTICQVSKVLATAPGVYN